ncbi:MAG: hypothetical protein LWW85_07125, partial [Marinilabiliales bacterium]|nr:hypothetical protein [Marinilabiliales bacterium]
MITGNKGVLKEKIVLSNASGKIEPISTRNGTGLPYWQIAEFVINKPGKYEMTLRTDSRSVIQQEVVIGTSINTNEAGTGTNQGPVWPVRKVWDAPSEDLYAAWINSMFYEAGEKDDWKALHEVTQNSKSNVLYNYLSMGEDDPTSKNRMIMQPDCADNPFFLRAYFAWKLGLPFGYHECDRGYLGKPPHTGKWITNEISLSGNSVR